MNFIPTLQPLATNQFGFAEAAHLLNRAGFGGSTEQIQAIQRMGLLRAVDYLVDYESVDDSSLEIPEYDVNLIRPYNEAERQLLRQNRNDQAIRDRLRAEQLLRQEQDRQQMVQLERWWLARMIATPRPLEEKLTLLWHGHFVKLIHEHLQVKVSQAN